MQHRTRVKYEAAAAVVLLFIALAMLMWARDANSQETVPEPAVAEHPAFGARHVSHLTVRSNVADIPKLEAKAVEILRRPGTVTGERMTLPEARAVVRVDGKTDVARCLEIVITDRLRGIVQADVSGVRLANEHPEPKAAQ